jgi:hypothetical protein
MGRRWQRAGKKGIYHKNKNFKISRGEKTRNGKKTSEGCKKRYIS